MNKEPKGSRLDAAVREAGRTDLSPDRIVQLFADIAGMSYRLSQEVADAFRAYANAEGDRKAYTAKQVIILQAAGMSNAKAVATVEASDEYQALRAKEIEAEADYTRWKLTAQGTGNVLSSLQMRAAWLRDERKATAQAHGG